MHLSCLGDPGSGAALCLFGVHVAAAVLRRGVLHGGSPFDVLWWASLLTSANAGLESRKSTIVGA